MRPMPAQEYNGYTIVANALPAPGNRYHSVFSVHKDSKTSIPSQVSVVYQQGRDAEVVCETADDAHEDAMNRAQAWIDEQPSC